MSTERRRRPAPGTSSARVGAAPRSAHPPHPERLWASNGFDHFRPRRGYRRSIALAVYWLALTIFFAAGFWALME